MSEKMLDLVHRMFRENDNLYPDPETLTQLFSPYTGADYVHFDGIEKGDWLSRGHVTKLHFWCEDGSRFSLCFGFHKGFMYAWVEERSSIWTVAELLAADFPAPDKPPKGKLKLRILQHLTEHGAATRADLLNALGCRSLDSAVLGARRIHRSCGT
jgi:hypothetical protein